jgi:pilus assembly protein CpaB
MAQGMTSPPAANPSASAAPDADDAAAIKSRRLLLVAALLTAAGAGLLVLYLRRFETEVSGGERVQLLAVVTPIARGTVLTQDMLGVREVPVSYVEPRAVKAAELSKVRGIRTAIDLDPQDSLLWTDLAVGVEDRDLSSLVQSGNRAYTIDVRSSGSGAASNELIRPGDYVDVLATFSDRRGVTAPTDRTKVLLQRVLVLAVGNETERQAFVGVSDKTPLQQRRAATLTLSLKIDEAQLMVLATKEGELSVVLRGAGDPTVLDGIPDLTPNNLVEAAVEANRRRNAQVTTSVAPVRIASSDRH